MSYVYKKVCFLLCVLGPMGYDALVNTTHWKADWLRKNGPVCFMKRGKAVVSQQGLLEMEIIALTHWGCETG